MRKHILRGAAVGATALFVLTLGLGDAAASPGHGAGRGAVVGMPGDAARASRSVEIDMYDNYYEPENLTFKDGETVRFVVRNKGAFVHEFNIGTAEQHRAHRPQMTMMVQHGVLLADRIDRAAARAMQASMGHGIHDEPNSRLLEPGQAAEIVWTFRAGGALEFACNVPGHYEAGMVGGIEVTP